MHIHSKNKKKPKWSRNTRKQEEVEWSINPCKKQEQEERQGTNPCLKKRVPTLGG